MSLIVSTKSPNFVSDTTVKPKMSRYFHLNESGFFKNKVAPIALDTTGLVSYWKLDESSGVAYDAVGGNHLTNNSVTYGDGKIGNGAVLNGSSGYLSITNASQTGLNITQDMTISCWYKPTDLISTGRIILSKFNYNGTNQRAYQLYYTNSSGYRIILGLSPDGSADSSASFDYVM